MSDWLRQFIAESNRIEGIVRPPTIIEVEAHEKALAWRAPSVSDLVEFVFAVQPDAQLRDKAGLDVIIGPHVPPRGGPEVHSELTMILALAHGDCGPGQGHPYRVHHLYETLHPFTDGNGRSGRMLWLWGMAHMPLPEWRRVKQLGFLHAYYYQSLQFSRSGDAT